MLAGCEGVANDGKTGGGQRVATGVTARLWRGEGAAIGPLEVKELSVSGAVAARQATAAGES